MIFPPINPLANIIAALAAFVIGFLFHGPLFGKTWMRLAGIHPTGNEKFSDMYGQMLANLLSNGALAVVFAVFIGILHQATALPLSPTVLGVWVAFWVWIATSAASSVEVIWMGRRTAHWLFEVGTGLVCYLVMGIIIGMFL